MPLGQCFWTCFVYEMQILWEKEVKRYRKISKERYMRNKEWDRYNTMSLCHQANVFEHVLFIKCKFYGKKRERGIGKNSKKKNKR